MGDDANNFRLNISLADFEEQALAYGIFIREIFPGEDFINHHYRRRVLIIARSKEAAAAKREFALCPGIPDQRRNQ